jgi:uncharacterized OB-fold protein
MLTAQRYAREIPQRYRMEAGKCKKCGEVFFPPRIVCAECKGREFDKINLSDEGKVVTYTVIRVAPTSFADEAPYAVGIIELKDGVRITAQIVDCALDQIKIGMDVRLEFRKLLKDGSAGILCYGYKCVLA